MCVCVCVCVCVGVGVCVWLKYLHSPRLTRVILSLTKWGLILLMAYMASLKGLMSTSPRESSGNRVPNTIQAERGC